MEKFNLSLHQMLKTAFNHQVHYARSILSIVVVVAICSHFRYESNGIFVLGVGFFFLQTNFDFLTSHF